MAPGSVDDIADRLEQLRSGLAPDNQSGVWRIVSRVRDVAGRHAKVVALLGLVAVIMAVWLVLRARTWSPEAIAEVTPSWSAEAPTASPTPPAPWLIHVLGAVDQPGLVSVPAGSRVADALAAAGGLAADADPAELNLAAELVDGCQVIVGTKVEPRGEVRVGAGGVLADGAGTGAELTGAVIDLNAATSEQLQSLPGVGPATATAILTWRAEHGRFADIVELQEISGIGPKTYEKIAPHVRV
jgi:competence protein ComEA